MEKNILFDRSPAVKSPCISVCVLNDDDICTGCFRSAKEITFWSRMNNDEKRQVLAKAGERSRRDNPFATPTDA